MLSYVNILIILIVLNMALESLCFQSSTPYFIHHLCLFIQNISRVFIYIY